MASLTSGSVPDGRTVSRSGLSSGGVWARAGPMSKTRLAIHRRRVIGNPAADLATGLQATLFRQGRIAALRLLAAASLAHRSLFGFSEPHAQAAANGMLLVALPDGAVIHDADGDLLAQ